MKHKLLIVDDEPANLRMLERLLKTEYDVISAESGADALELLSHNDVALIISDQRMPGMTGIEFLRKAAEARRQTVRIILTGYTDVGDLVEAINSGIIYKYITKPWVNSDLCQTIQRGLQHFEAMKRHYLQAQENKRLVARLSVTKTGILALFREMIFQKSSSLAEHCRRTSEYASVISKRLGLPDREEQKVVLAALLHEAPNIRMPFEMVFDRTALTPEQYGATRKTFENGLRLVSDIPDFEEIGTIIKYQHEHFDGTGFFDGLDGNKIPFLSRLLAVANAFDELVSRRNPGLQCTDAEAVQWLRKRAGIRFDPHLVNACIDIHRSALTAAGKPSLLTEQSRPIVFADVLI